MKFSVSNKSWIVFVAALVIGLAFSVYFLVYVKGKEREMIANNFRVLQQIVENVKTLENSFLKNAETRSITNNNEEFNPKITKAEEYQCAELTGLDALKRKKVLYGEDGLFFKVDTVSNEKDSAYSKCNYYFTNYNDFFSNEHFQRKDIFDQIIITKTIKSDPYKIVLYSNAPVGMLDTTFYNHAMQFSKEELWINDEPYVSFNQTINRADIVLTGLILKSRFESQKRSVSAFVIFIMSTALFLMILAMPILKLRIMSPVERLHIKDVVFGVVSMLIGPALLIVFLYTAFVSYSAEKDALQENIRSLSNKIEENFQKELGEAIHQIEVLNSAFAFAKDANIYPKVRLKPEDLEKNKFWLDDESSDQFLYLGPEDPILSSARIRGFKVYKEIINRDLITLKHVKEIFWCNDSAQALIFLSVFNKSGYAQDLSHRKYISNILGNKPTYFKDNKDVAHDIGLEVIKSVNDGSYEVGIGKATGGKTLPVLAMSIKMASVMGTVMEEGYGFCIFDKKGNTIFHSDIMRSLNENFLSETKDVFISDIESNSETIENINYNGKEQIIYFRPLDCLSDHYIATFVDSELQYGPFTLAMISAFELFLGYLILILVIYLLLYFSNYGISKLKQRTYIFNFIRPFETPGFYIKYKRQVVVLVGVIMYLTLTIFINNRFYDFVLSELIFISIILLVCSFYALSVNLHEENLILTKVRKPSKTAYAMVLVVLVILIVSRDIIIVKSFSSWTGKFGLLLNMLVGLAVVAFITLDIFLEKNILRLEYIDRAVRRASEIQKAFMLFIVLFAILFSIIPINLFVQIAYEKENDIFAKYRSLQVINNIRNWEKDHFIEFGNRFNSRHDYDTFKNSMTRNSRNHALSETDFSNDHEKYVSVYGKNEVHQHSDTSVTVRSKRYRSFPIQAVEIVNEHTFRVGEEDFIILIMEDLKVGWDSIHIRSYDSIFYSKNCIDFDEDGTVRIKSKDYIFFELYNRDEEYNDRYFIDTVRYYPDTTINRIVLEPRKYIIDTSQYYFPAVVKKQNTDAGRKFLVDLAEYKLLRTILEDSILLTDIDEYNELKTYFEDSISIKEIVEYKLLKKKLETSNSITKLQAYNLLKAIIDGQLPVDADDVQLHRILSGAFSVADVAEYSILMTALDSSITLTDVAKYKELKKWMKDPIPANIKREYDTLFALPDFSISYKEFAEYKQLKKNLDDLTLNISKTDLEKLESVLENSELFNDIARLKIMKAIQADIISYTDILRYYILHGIQNNPDRNKLASALNNPSYSRADTTSFPDSIFYMEARAIANKKLKLTDTEFHKKVLTIIEDSVLFAGNVTFKIANQIYINNKTINSRENIKYFEDNIEDRANASRKIITESFTFFQDTLDNWNSERINFSIDLNDELVKERIRFYRDSTRFVKVKISYVKDPEDNRVVKESVYYNVDTVETKLIKEYSAYGEDSIHPPKDGTFQLLKTSIIVYEDTSSDISYKSIIDGGFEKRTIGDRSIEFANGKLGKKIVGEVQFHEDTSEFISKGFFNSIYPIIRPNYNERSNITQGFIDDIASDNYWKFRSLAGEKNIMMVNPLFESNMSLKMVELPKIDFYRAHFWLVIVVIILSLMVLFKLLNFIVTKIYGFNFRNYAENVREFDGQKFNEKYLSRTNHSTTSFYNNIFVVGVNTSNTFFISEYFEKHKLAYLNLDFYDFSDNAENKTKDLSDYKGDLKLSNFMHDWNEIKQHFDNKKEAYVLVEHFEFGYNDLKMNKLKLEVLKYLVDYKNFKVIIKSEINATKFLDFYEESIKEIDISVKNASGEERLIIRSRLDDLRIDYKKWQHLFGSFINYIVPISSDMVESKSAANGNNGFIEKETMHGEFLNIVGEYISRTEVKQLMEEDKILTIQQMSYTHYFSIWNSLSKEERYLIYDIAMDKFVNTVNTNAIFSLLNKGILVYDHSLRLFNESFANFVLTTVSNDEALEMEKESKKKGTWNTAFAVILLLIVSLVVFLSIGQQSFLNDINAFLTAIAALVGLLVRFGGFMRLGGSKSVEA